MHKERVHNYKPGPKIPKKSQKEEKSPKPEKKEKPPKLLRSPGKHHQVHLWWESSLVIMRWRTLKAGNMG